MFLQFRKQNWIVLTVLLILLVLLIVFTTFFANNIYNDFKNLLSKNEDTILDIYSQNVQHSLQDIDENLLLLSNLVCMKDYLNSSFESEQLKDQLLKSLSEVVNSNESHIQIIIKDSSGNEKISVFNKNIPYTPSYYKTSTEDEFFQSSYELKKNEFNFLITTLKVKNINKDLINLPILKISTPLFDLNENKVGILIIDVNLESLFKILPKNIFIQTNDGYIIQSQTNGMLNYKKSYYEFNYPKGLYEIGDFKEIHYQKIEYLNKKLLIIGLYNDHSELKQTINFIILLSAVISLLIFSSLVINFLIIYRRFKNVIEANKAIISALAKLSEYRDEVTGKHLKRVSKYSVTLSKELSHNSKFKKILSKEYIEDLEIAVQLHDIGKVGIRDSILLKKGKLTIEEYEEMKKHVSIGIEIINEITSNIKIHLSFFELGKNIIKFHHEKFDGTGYPFKLKGSEIPLEARIFSLVDAYDAIRSKRPYKNEISHEEALDRIIIDRGKHFDPEIVDAFLKCNQAFNEISNL